jgi:hypothetical protein
MKRLLVVIVLAAAVFTPAALARTITVAAHAGTSKTEVGLCSSSYVSAVIAGEPKCLRDGEFCQVGNGAYRAYGFNCGASGHLVTYQGSTAPVVTHVPATTASGPPNVGATVLIGRRTRATGCARSTTPDRRCSPGAYYSRLTALVICSQTFRTGTIRDVPQSEKFEVEREYGMPASYYGRSIEIDHIVPLELGGSNDIANLYPEPGSGNASYHVKDELENRLHDLVCAGSMTLPAAQQQIATNWRALYRKVFGTQP